MGVMAIEVFDPDIVAEENLATQFHRLGDLGRLKVEALKDMLLDFADETVIDALSFAVGPFTELGGGIVISAVDSIRARKDIWKAFLGCSARWYLDARMGAQEFHLHVIDRKNVEAVKWYAGLLSEQTDENVAQEPCTAKATIFTSAFCSALIGRTVKQIAVGETPYRHYVYNLKNDFLFVQ